MSDKILPPGPKEPYDIGFTDNALAQLEEYIEEYGRTFKVYSPFRKAYTYVLGDPDLVKYVLVQNNRNYTKGVGLDRVKILLGNGIMVSEGDYWRRQRRMIQPAFHKKVIRQLSENMRHLNEKHFISWKEKASKGESLNITKEMSEMTLRVVLDAIFSKDLWDLEEKTGENPFDLVTNDDNRDLQFAMKFRALTKFVRQFKEQREKEERIEFDFLSMLMETTDKETGEKMTEKELMDEVMTLIVAGHETTAGTLNWVWYLLATHPEVQEKLYEEVQNLGGTVPSFEDLGALGYTEQVIKEAMRLYPPGWLLTRRAIHEDQIGDFYTEAKTDIFISPYLIQRDPEWWPEPEKFDPERFSPEKVKSMHKFSYFPFAGGPRQCIGDFFAMVEMQIHVGYMAQKFRIEYEDRQPIELEPQVNLRTRHDLHFKLHSR